MPACSDNRMALRRIAMVAIALSLGLVSQRGS